MPQRSVRIINARGLHARPAAKIVKLAAGFDAEVMVSNEETRVSAASIMGLLLLAAAPGTDLQLTAEGRQAEEALDAVAALIATGFGEVD